MSSTETGVIFGNIVYEGGGMAERGVVVLADIHIDIMDYIAPAHCADVAFRNMWAEFEWENKVRGCRWGWGWGWGVGGAAVGPCDLISWPGHACGRQQARAGRGRVMLHQQCSQLCFTAAA